MLNDKTVIGTFEKVSFPHFGVKNVMAKIDTGAYTGALHCTHIQEVETPDGKVVEFVPFGQANKKQFSSEYYVKTVKSSNGSREKRFIISTEIELQGTVYAILLSLTDRSAMKNPVLIGRRFLRTNKMVVDALQFKK